MDFEHINQHALVIDTTINPFHDDYQDGPKLEFIIALMERVDDIRREDSPWYFSLGDMRFENMPFDLRDESLSNLRNHGVTAVGVGFNMERDTPQDPFKMIEMSIYNNVVCPLRPNRYTDYEEAVNYIRPDFEKVLVRCIGMVKRARTINKEEFLHHASQLLQLPEEAINDMNTAIINGAARFAIYKGSENNKVFEKSIHLGFNSSVWFKPYSAM